MQDNDLISRQAAIDACLKGKTDGLPATNVACDCCAERIRVLPSAQPTQSNTSNTLESLDCIDRQAAIDAINKALSRVFTEPCGEQILKDLPSAQPEYEELTPEEAASEIASETLMSVWYWLDDLTRLKQMGYAICRKR